MPNNLLERASVWLARQRRAFVSVRVLYVTQSGKVIRCHATVGRTAFNAPNEYGVIVRTHSRDFLITQLELSHEPTYGDIIVWQDRIYEVLAPEGKCVWRWSDLFHTTKRIHTKFFKDADGAYDDDWLDGDEGNEDGDNNGGNGGDGNGNGDGGDGSATGCPCCPCKTCHPCRPKCTARRKEGCLRRQ